MTSRSRSAFAMAALLIMSVLAPAFGGALVATAPASAASGAPSGMAAVSSTNIDDIRPSSVATNISESDLDGAVYVSKHASTTEVDIVTAEQAVEVARGASPADVAHDRVCGSPAGARSPAVSCDTSMSVVISDSTNHEGREVAIRVDVVREALGYVPETIAISNNETGETWRSPATVRDGWLITDVEHFSSNSVSFTGTVSVKASPAQNGDSFTTNLTDLDSATDPNVTFTGWDSTAWDNESKAGITPGGSMAVSLAGNAELRGNSANGNPELRLTGHAGSVKTNGVDSWDRYEEYLFGTKNGKSISSEVTYNADNLPGAITQLEFYKQNDANDSIDVTVDVYIVKGEGADGVYSEGTLVKDNWNPSVSTDQYNTRLDLGKTVYPASASQNITIEFVTNSAEATDEYVYTLANSTMSTSATYSYQGTTEQQLAKMSVLGEPRSITVSDGYGNSVSVSKLNDSETTTVEFPVNRSATSLSVSNFHAGTVDATLLAQEVSVTENPELSINGNPVSVSGKLSDGSSVTKTGNSSWLVEGTNYWNVTVGSSLSSDAPTPTVGIDASHEATSSYSVNYSAEALSVRYEVGKNFTSSQSSATLSIPFENTVYEMRDVEKSVNGGSWKSVSSSNYAISSSNELVVDLGSVSKGDTVKIRVNGSRVATHNMTIAVVEPTAEGDDLDSKIRIESFGENAHLTVAGADNPAKLYYPTLESWSSPKGYVTVHANGKQNLYLPNAASGETFRLKQHGTKASPATNEVKVRFTDTGVEPKFKVMPGAHEGDPVEFTYYNTKSDVEYVLQSKTHEVTRDSATANSPVVLDDDDSLETLAIFEESTSSGSDSDTSTSDVGSVFSGAKEATSTLPVEVIVLGAVVVTVLIYFVSRRTPGSSRVLLYATVPPVWVVALEFAGIPIVTAPLQAASQGFGKVFPALALGGGALLLYYAYVKFIKDASTPEKVNRISFNIRGGDKK